MKRFVVELSDDTWNRLRAYTKAENADCDTKLTPQEMAEVILRINLETGALGYEAPEEWEDENAPQFKQWNIFWKEYKRLNKNGK